MGGEDMNANERSRVVLVTGVSSGFGRAIATALAKDGHRVFGTERVRRREPPAGVTTLPLDVTNDESVAACVDAVVRTGGRLDVLVNNAGMGIAGAIEDTSVEEAKAQFETNFFGAHRMCRAVLRHMREQHGGHIINMSSLAGLVPIPFQAFYCATKFAIEAYTEALRMEVRPYGIAVSMIEPGDFATGFTANRRLTAASTGASPYHERCSRAIKRMADDEQKYTDLSPVVRAVAEILGRPRPALRYPRAAAVQRLLVALRPFVPQAVFEYLLVDAYDIG
jgi:NAD(P)-dependent dehydrogenase (short-subunit alcohol dehydrogenase family)